MAQNLEARLLEWLRKTGYPLELRIGKQFQRVGWNVNYSRWYQDPIAEKKRELDVQVSVTATRERTSMHVSLCIECKTSVDKPWVALSSGVTVGDDISLDFAVGRLSRMALTGATAEGVELPRIVSPGTLRVGGVVQAFFGSGKKPRPQEQEEASPTSPYAALVQARSAALALDTEYRANALEIFGELKTAAVFLPVVIVDAPLFAYAVGANGEDILHSVEAVVASVPGEGDSEAAVPVLSRQYAEQHCIPLLSSARSFCVRMLPHVSTVIGTIRIDNE
jgi:hypothetical protein